MTNSAINFDQYRRNDSPIRNQSKDNEITKSVADNSVNVKNNFEQYKRSSEPEEEGIFTLRNVGRTLKSVGSTIAGAPGDFNNLIESMVSKGMEYLTGKPTDKPVKLGLIDLPTSSNIKGKIEEVFPESKARTPGEKEYEKNVELATGLALPGPGGKIQVGRALLGTGLGIGAKELSKDFGASEETQEAAKMITSMIPLLIQGKISPTNKEMKDLYNAGKKLGYTDKQLAPLFQPETKKWLLQHAAKPTKSVRKNILEGKEKFGEVFSDIRERAKELPVISKERSKPLEKSFYGLLEDLEASKLPTNDKIDAIKKVEHAIKSLESGTFKPHEAIDTWRDINKSLGKSGAGQQPLASVKKHLLNILEDSDPILTKDFVMQNKLYQKFKGYEEAFSPSLKKQISEGIISGGEGLTLLTGIATGNVDLITAAVGTEVARRIATNLLTKPSWQSIHKNAVKALVNQSPKVGMLVEKQIKQKLDK